VGIDEQLVVDVDFADCGCKCEEPGQKVRVSWFSFTFPCTLILKIVPCRCHSRRPSCTHRDTKRGRTPAEWSEHSSAALATVVRLTTMENSVSALSSPEATGAAYPRASSRLVGTQMPLWTVPTGSSFNPWEFLKFRLDFKWFRWICRGECLCGACDCQSLPANPDEVSHSSARS